MTAQPKFPTINPENVQIPAGKTFEQWLEGQIVRYSTRIPDWDALKFQADYDPKYRRAQLRYVGTGGTGVDSDAHIGYAQCCRIIDPITDKSNHFFRIFLEGFKLFHFIFRKEPSKCRINS